MNAHPLSDIVCWRRLRPEGKSLVVAELAGRLGPAFRPEPVTLGQEKLVALRHLESDTRFVAIPGGTFSMGLSDAEAAELESIGCDPADHFAASRPVRSVAVRGFLCSQAPLLPAAAKGLGTRATQPWILVEGSDPDACNAGPSPEDALPGDLPPRLPARSSRRNMPVTATAPIAAALMRRWGFRFLSEAEWEYVAREGGSSSWISGSRSDLEVAIMDLLARPWFTPGKLPETAVNTFALWGLGATGWVADDWHPSYHGAPADGGAWGAPEVPRVCRGGSAEAYPWQDSSDCVWCHAAYRAAGADDEVDMALVAFAALDLPADLPDVPEELFDPEADRRPPRERVVKERPPTYRVGERITVTVGAVTQRRAYVDWERAGVKQTGSIACADLADPPPAEPADVLAVDQIIEVVVLRLHNRIPILGLKQAQKR